MEILLFIIGWYIIGLISSFLTAYFMFTETRKSDISFLCSMGLAGPINIFSMIFAIIDFASEKYNKRKEGKKTEDKVIFERCKWFD